MTDELTRRQRLVLATVTLTTAVYGVQQQMVIPTLPVIQRSLHTSTAWITWVLTAFLLTSCVSTPLLGRLGDQFGKKRLLTISLLCVVIGAAGATAAPNIAVLIACRALQGAAGALFPLGIALLAEELPRGRIGYAVGMVSTVQVVAGGIGLAAAGLIVNALSWRYLFATGGAVAVVALVLLRLVVPEPTKIAGSSRVDVRGGAMLTVTLAALLLALTEAPRWGWAAAPTLGLLATAAVGLAVWIRVELIVPEPMVDVHALARRSVLLVNATSFLGPGMALIVPWVLVPRFATDIFGANIAVAALYTLPASVGGLFSGRAAAGIGARFGWRWSLALGQLLCAVGVGMIALWHTQPWQVLVGGGLVGIGLPFMTASAAKLLLDEARPGKAGVTMGINIVWRNVGAITGAQLTAALLTMHTIRHSTVPSEAGFALSFAVCAVAALVGAVLSLGIGSGTPFRRRRLTTP